MTIIAVFWAILVAFLTVVLVRLARVAREAERLVANIADQSVPLLGELTDAVKATNAQLVRVDAISGNVQTMTANATALSSTVSATLGGPLVKTAAFSHGVRRALSPSSRAEFTRRMRAGAKEQARLRRRTRKGD